MAAAWLLALAALPVAPVPASAQTEIWSATLTVEVTTALPTSVGFREGLFGALSDTDFVREGATYRVFDIFYYQQTGSFLLFGLDAGLADTCGLVLELDNLELKFRDAEALGGTTTYEYAWASSSLGWTDDQSVEVKLVVSDGSPCAPTGLTATAQNDRVALAWTAGGNGDSAITKHQVCRKEVSSFQFSCAATDWADISDSAPNEANATSYTVRNLENGTEYAFRVRAVNEDGGGIASNDATATPMATAPDAPTGLEAEAGDKSVTLRWTAGSDGGSAVTSHQYRRKTTGAFEAWQDIPESAAEEANAGSFTVSSGLTNDTAYTFEVQARNAEGDSGPSNQASATPVAGDTTAPVLMSATTTALALALTYDEDLDADSEPAPSAFTVTVDGASRGVTGVSVGAKVLLTLAPAVRAGETVTVSYTVPAMNPLRDEANNPAAAFSDHPVTNEVPATAPEAPTGLTATPGDGSVSLRWTASAHDGGSEVTSHQYRHKTTGAFGSWQDIELSAPGEANATSYPVTSLMNDTAYTFEVQARNAEDESRPSNQASATPVAGDSTAPVLQSATTTALEVGLTYDEDLDADSEPAPSAFTVTVNGASRTVTGVSVGDTKVLLTLAPAVRAGDLVRVSYTVPAMNPLWDEASNPAAAFGDHPVTNETTATVPDAPTGLAATSGDGSVTLRWTASAYDGGSEVTGHQYRQKTTGDFGSWEDIADSAEGEANATSNTVTSLMNDTAYTFEVQARNAEGESGPSNQASATPVAGDSTAPMLRSATTTARELALIYDEDLDADSEPAPSAFTVTGDGASRTVTGVSVGAKVLLTLAPAVRAGETVTVSYTVPAMNPLRDDTGNPAAAFADHPVTNEVPATAPEAPTGLEATPGDGSVTLRWTASAHDGGSEVTSHQYRHKTTGGFGVWQDIELSAPGEANATSYPVTSLMNDAAYTFEVQARNAEGESGPSNQASATPVAGDTTAPVLMSATTTALELKLFYDEDLDADSEPAPSAFSVTVDGASRAVTGVSVGAKVLLTLASAVRAGDLVTVSYTVPANNPLRDEASNPAAAFADHPVTNETPATAPDAPSNLEATPGDGSVTLRWTASAHDGGRAVTGHQYCRKEGTVASCTADGDWMDIADSAPGGANATGYTVANLTNGTGYTFRVRARNAEGESDPSTEAGTTPDAAAISPGLVRAVSAGFGRMVGSQALHLVSAHLEGGGGSQVTVGGERFGGPAEAALARLAAAARDGDEGPTGTRTGREVLLGSSFRLQSEGKETGAPGAAAWGGMAAGRFETRSDGVATEGEVTTGMVGADVSSGRWLAGGALSHARGKGSFAASAERAEGASEVRLTTVHPYARVRLGERMSAWGLAGYGKGELTVTAAGGERVATGLRMRMGAVGARGTLVPAAAGGGFELALKTDALWMRVSSEAAEGLPGARADARRLRLVLDASRVVETGGGATLTPRFEAGVRRDGGDTGSGTGLEVGAGLRYARSAVTVEGRVRALVLHEASGYEEWGASGSVRVDPSASGRGLSLTLAPAWGDASSAVERLWSLRDPGGLAANDDFEAGARLDAEVGYGLRGPRGVGVATPWAGLGLAREEARAWRAGARWKLAPDFTLGLEATRHEPSTDDPPEHRLMLRGALRW